MPGYLFKKIKTMKNDKLNHTMQQFFANAEKTLEIGEKCGEVEM